ncbi:hypothetical protein BC834DRAFT_784226, partial [Gloeopeniophorella convolvens]
IRDAYTTDPLFAIILQQPEAHTNFIMEDGFVWLKQNVGRRLLCIPAGLHEQRSIRELIIDSAHKVVGHFGERKTANYLRRWYWW